MKTRISILIFALIALVSPLRADDALHIFYQDGTRDTYDLTPDLELRFEKRPFLEEHVYSITNKDTIFFSADAGRTNFYGQVISNYPWTLSVDADWLLAKKDESGKYDAEIRYECEGLFMLYATANESDKERVGHLSIISNEDPQVRKEFVVLQHPFRMSFLDDTFINNGRFDGPVLDTLVKEFAWNDTIFSTAIFPNHTWQVTSCPDWMKAYPYKHGAEDYCFDSIMTYDDIFAVNHMATYIRFGFEQNLSSEDRSGEIVFEGNGQKIVAIVTQPSIDDAATLAYLTEMQEMIATSMNLASSSHVDFGPLSTGLAGDIMAGDIFSHDYTAGYDWFSGDYIFNNNEVNYFRNELNWRTFYSIVSEANTIIDEVNAIKAYVNNADYVLGNAYAYRAYAYLNLIQLFQNPTLPDVSLGLTMPGVPLLFSKLEMEDMTDEKINYFRGRNTVAEVFALIEADITKAIDLIAATQRSNKQFIDKAVAQGIAARYYLLTQQWDKAAQMAQAARSGYPIMSGTAEENGIRDGFMHLSNTEWMWGFDHKDYTFNKRIPSFFSHISPFCSSGYGGIIARLVDAKLFAQMSESDYRRMYWFNDADGNTSSTVEKTTSTSRLPYALLKFGDLGDWSMDYPYMRASEMLLIEAEAYAQLSQPELAARALSELMAQRDPSWSVQATSSAVLSECRKQRRLELIGEGFSYYDLKRWAMGIDRNYEGSNHPESAQIAVEAGSEAWIYKIPLSGLADNLTYDLDSLDNVNVYQYLYENQYSLEGDTIFMSASAGRTNSYGLLNTNLDSVIFSFDVDWLMVKQNQKEDYLVGDNQKPENLFMIYAKANESTSPRVGHVNISSVDGGVTKQLTVLQQGYALSFAEQSFVNGGRYDGQVVDTFVIEASLDHEYIYFNLYPNHGWKVSSYPDWMKMRDFTHGAESCSFESIVAADDIFQAGQPLVSTITFDCDLNTTQADRKAEIVFEANGQKVIGVFHQPAINDDMVLDLMRQAQAKMTAFRENHDDASYPAIMHAMDMMGEDLVMVNTAYSWFAYDYEHDNNAENYRRNRFVWNFFYEMIEAANAAIDVTTAIKDYVSVENLVLGNAYAYRAFAYLNLIQLFQQPTTANATIDRQLPAVPVLLSNTELAAIDADLKASLKTRNNVGIVLDYIEADLQKAMTLLENVERPDKNFIDHSVVCGMAARYYLLVQDWEKAAAMAAQASSSYALMSADTQTNSIRDGFMHLDNTEWMWGYDQPAETSSYVASFFSFVSPLSNGYAGGFQGRLVDARLFNQMSDTDSRKLYWYRDAAGTTSSTAVAGELAIYYHTLPYAFLKFGWQENFTQDIPYMRAAEMLLIRAEALFRSGEKQAAYDAMKQLMDQRDADWMNRFTAETLTLDEILLQRRMELIGEGFSYYDLKRLRKGINRAYDGTNHPEACRLTIDADQPAWIYVIPQTAYQDSRFDL